MKIPYGSLEKKVARVSRDHFYINFEPKAFIRCRDNVTVC